MLAATLRDATQARRGLAVDLIRAFPYTYQAAGPSSQRLLHSSPSCNDDLDLDPESIQAKMLAKLQSRYTKPQPPQASAQQHQRQQQSPPDQSPSPLPPSVAEQATTSPEAAAEAITHLVAESLIEAEATGVAQAALAAETASPAQPPPPSDTTPAEAPTVGKYEEGRFLPKTPDNSPWLARYVRPSHAGSAEGADVPSIYYGKLLKPGGIRGNSSGTMKSTSQRLKDLGVNPASLPLNDAKAMRAVQAGIRRFERAGRMVGAKHGAWQYKSRKLSEAEIEQFRQEVEAEAARALEEDETTDYSDDGNRTVMRRGFPTGTDTSRAPGGGGGSGMTLRRWTSVADERIEAARAAGLFKENKLRGKPLEAEIHERNPYLGHEERLMNRMIKKQGASPPWVELNNTFHSHLGQFRGKLVDTFARRAVRALTQSGALLSSGGPGTGTTGGTEESRRAYFLALAQGYRDANWEREERAYHEESVKDLNDTLRRYNSIAPPSARKSPVVREVELQRCYEVSAEVIAEGLNEAWLEVTGQKVRPDMSSGMFGGKSGPQVYDIWGRPVQDNASTSAGNGGGWSLSSLFARDHAADLERSNVGGDGDERDSVRNRSDADQTGLHRRSKSSAEGVGLITKIKQWLALEGGSKDGEEASRRS
ncbi:hypothetical protein BDZ90DRAFT_229633 [Jaminaea rosea]|uniref:DnaJ homologue subfamily C member 28 conserved domain-containing protein n=1 Tax=Jaminaea rosea TaxID=1569628 RepID=A0A316UZH3_9BASI|nr:hypothetical protein BDZ90DRAFT_229633 [Jaminaea rosea]PWN30622.1 hypothetical protein BDZ90DRAFT_229633 [Jaminaea rosea]